VLQWSSSLACREHAVSQEHKHLQSRVEARSRATLSASLPDRVRARLRPQRARIEQVHRTHLQQAGTRRPWSLRRLCRSDRAQRRRL